MSGPPSPKSLVHVSSVMPDSKFGFDSLLKREVDMPVMGLREPIRCFVQDETKVGSCRWGLMIPVKRKIEVEFTGQEM